jgi:hypothetical protein
MSELIENIIICIGGITVILYALVQILKSSYHKSQKQTKNENVDT